ncbi:MAG TPA: caspase family protein, partial [Pyrinomonadaceae bacterium]
MRKATLLVVILFAFGPTPALSQTTPWKEEQTRSIIVGTHEREPNRLVKLYGESHALVIGMSDYKDEDWKDLSGVESDVPEVSAALDEQGFKVEKVVNVTGARLLERIESFINEHGREEQNRLLIYYAGHGFKTSEGGREVGYIVPIDAPSPDKAPAEFAAKAVNMTRIMALAAKIRSKHALLVLDSCFSGSLIDAAQSLPDAAAASAVGTARFTTVGARRTADDTSPRPPHPHDL